MLGSGRTTAGTTIPARSSAVFMRSRIVRATVTCSSGADLAVIRMMTASPETDSTPAKLGRPSSCPS